MDRCKRYSPQFEFTGTKNGPVTDLSSTNFFADNNNDLYNNGLLKSLTTSFFRLCGFEIAIGGGQIFTVGGGKTETSTISADEFILEVYPNPIKDIFTINLSNQPIQKLSLYDIQGKIVQEIRLEKGQQNFEMNIQHLENGMYILKVNDTAIQRIIKQD